MTVDITHCWSKGVPVCGPHCWNKGVPRVWTALLQQGCSTCVDRTAAARVFQCVDRTAGARVFHVCRPHCWSKGVPRAWTRSRQDASAKVSQCSLATAALPQLTSFCVCRAFFTRHRGARKLVSTELQQSRRDMTSDVMSCVMTS